MHKTAGRVKSCLICALALSLASFSNAVEVSNFSDFQSAYQDANTTEIILNSDLTATGDILTSSSNDLTIIGNNTTIDASLSGKVFDITGGIVSISGITFGVPFLW